MEEPTAKIEEEWKAARRRNPYLSLDYTGEQVRGHWDRVSEDYGGSVYDGSRMMMFADLESMGLIGPDLTYLDIGSGPGLYDIAFARCVKEIFCMDGSSRMLARLKDECRRAGVSNITPVLSLWEDFRPRRKYDVVFSSLCPAVYDPDSFRRMEGMCSGHCVYVTAANRSNDINTRIWNQLETDYSPGGMPVDYPFRFLRSLGREPSVMKYYRNTVVESDPDEMVASQISYFKKYVEVDGSVEEIIRRTVGENIRDGIVRENRDAVLSMMVWEP